MRNSILLSIFFFAGLHGLFSQSIVAYPDTTVCSDEPVTLHALVDGVWGTDSYAYEVIPFAPEPISGTSITMVDDTHVPSGVTGYAIGFDFCFFGVVYDHFWIASNGWISFEKPSDAMDINWTPDGPVPDDAYDVPRPAIYGPWEDWNTGACSNCVKYETVGTAPNRKLIVTWDEVPMFWCGTEGTFQIVLHETTNIIDNHLIEIPSCPPWGDGYSVQGLENADGDVAFSAPGRNYAVWETSDESNRWVPNAINWYITSSWTFIGTGDSVIVNPSETTTYTAEVTLCDGTTVSDEVTVTVASPYEVTTYQENIECNGDNDGLISLTITGNINPMIYTWSNGSDDEDLSDLGPGDYSVTIVEEGGCTTTLDFTITEPPLLIPDTIATKNITCFNGYDGFIHMTAVGGTLPLLYSIDGINWQSGPDFDDLPAGEYTVSVIDSFDCLKTFDVILTEPPAVTVDAGDDIVMQYGAFAEIDATTSATDVASSLWVPQTALSCSNCMDPEATPENTTAYTLTVTDAAGCTGHDDITIIVQYDLVTANVFSPNGDGINDYFMVDADFIVSLELTIYNRWGQVVFHTDKMRDAWDGTLSGKESEIGGYNYVARIVNTNGEESIKTGTLILLR